MAFISRIKRLFTHDGRKPTILSIKDMMSMSDEELGREFSKCGEWHTPNYSYLESAFENIFVTEFFYRAHFAYRPFGRLVHDDFL